MHPALSVSRECLAWLETECPEATGVVHVGDPAPVLVPHEVEAVRKRLGLTQAEFARLIGVGEADVQAFEAGTSQADADACRRIVELR